jgi:Trehalose receptor
MAILAANVHDETKKPIEILRKVPCNGWCIEVMTKFVVKKIHFKLNFPTTD